METNPERERIIAAERRTAHWRRWGPYLSDRQWGTVREDYSPNGTAWEYFPFEQSRIRAYRWGEDGILGISDNHQRLCFAPAFWNENDPIVKERFYGVTGPQGNHGEDVKEYWYYLDNVPSHAYMKALYKYPQRRFPYEDLLGANARRTRDDPEYELVDTGIFADDRYFDIEIEYAKRAVDDVLIRISITNRGPETAPLHVLPTVWFRNEWAWRAGVAKPSIADSPRIAQAMILEHPTLGKRWLFHDTNARDRLFTDNETNYRAAFGTTSPTRYTKDGLDRYIVAGDEHAVNAARIGTKAAPHYALRIAPGATETIRLRLTDQATSGGIDAGFDATFDQRRAEADLFYLTAIPGTLSDDERRIQRQAFAGLLWSKQYYCYIVRDWLMGDPLMPAPPESRLHGRNAGWIHLYNDDILSMPDTWEYPWYASWDLAFHVIPLAIIDPGFAKQQQLTLTREFYMHPNGQIPAYEWAFDDVNPPVQAWAAYRTYKIEAKHYGTGDITFLERIFTKLLLNFTWWVNRKDVAGKNVFQGGFLGLDNIGVFDRSSALPTGGYLAQADGTSWMGVYSLNMLVIAVELAKHDPVYEDIASKFFEHFLYIADAMNSLRSGDEGLWDDFDGFYYDQLFLPDQQRIALKVRSMVGLIPLFAVETISSSALDKLPRLKKRIDWFVKNRPELSENVAHLERRGSRSGASWRSSRPKNSNASSSISSRRTSFSVPTASVRSRNSTPNIRTCWASAARPSASTTSRPNRRHRPSGETRIGADRSGSRSTISSSSRCNASTSIWVTNSRSSSDRFGRELSLWDISMELAQRLIGLFRRDPDGRRPASGATELFQTDPHWRDHIAFYEYFHGDTGAGLGASHQTGWTALVAKLIQQVAEYAGPEHPPLAWDFDVPVTLLSRY